MFGSQLVHIDLKGAPFKLNYWEELIPFLSRIGINGLLIEYEDMFPYNDYLSEINGENVYDIKQIESIIRVANNFNLKIIPLIQTFGHLEFVLKHRVFRELREIQTYPNSICPSNQKSLEVIKEMVRQMISLHQKFTKIDAIHIGCDEVWHLGQCSKCQTHLENGLERGQLFIDFVVKICQYIQDTFAIKVIIWDDMLRNINVQHIIESKLNLMVEPHGLALFRHKFISIDRQPVLANLQTVIRRYLDRLCIQRGDKNESNYSSNQLSYKQPIGLGQCHPTQPNI